jgi:hypothetical protein
MISSLLLPRRLGSGAELKRFLGILSLSPFARLVKQSRQADDSFRSLSDGPSRAVGGVTNVTIGNNPAL